MNLKDDLNSPIDAVQADCMALRQLVLGWIAEAKVGVAAWVPAPMPQDWYGDEQG